MEVDDFTSAGVKTDFTVNSDGSITVDEITIPPPPVPALTVEATSERLIITELIVRDFKSYAGTHTIGPLNKNFTCIVGPNGSGKSNVIDALLFVFGYRAQRIRSKKVSVLIHNSHKHPDLSSCSVTVNFATIKDEGQSYTILPDSKFYVTRTGYKDNSSTYEVNGRQSKYKDVATLLRNYRIDLDYNRFMILQGEIELISMMKPKAPTEQDTGMLEYIEDIIGSNRFIKPIQNFNSKVEEMNEIRLRKMNQLKIIEKERADAEKPRNQAMEYLRLANELALMENSVLQAQIQVVTEESEKLASDKALLLEKIKELTTSLDELQANKLLKEDVLKDIASEHEALAKSVDDFKHQFSALERADVACRENMKNNKEKIKKITKSLESEEVKMRNIKKQPEVLKGEIIELEAKKEKLQATKNIEEEKLKEVMGSVKDEIEEFQEEKDSLETKLVDLKTVVHEKKSELDLVQSELDILLSSEKKEKETFEVLQADYNKIISSIKEKERTLSEADTRIPEIKFQLTSAKDKFIDYEKRELSLTEELKTKRNKLDESKNSLNASENRNALIKAFMEQKKKGKLTGVYGRLGDLGAIDAKYDVAISTACGPLDNIVTDTMTTAQECVEFLKANNLGYATFIALDQMKKWEPYTKEKISTPENVPRLFDLISVKDKDVLTAFYYALKNTLVASDLDQATRVGLQGASRNRVVTLKGELIDLSGTMSGGGGKCFKGRMGQSVASDSSVSQTEVAKLAEEVENLTKELAEIKKCKLELKETIEQTDKEHSTLRLSVRKFQQNRDSFLEQEKMLLKQIEEQKLKIVAAAPNKKEVAKVQERIQQHEKSHNKATSAASVIENKIKDLQEQIMSITKGKYGAAQKKIDKLVKDIDQVSQNILKNTAMLKNSDKNLKKAQTKVESMKSELEVCQGSVDSLKEEFKEIESKGLEVSDLKGKAAAALLLCEVQKAAVMGEVKGLSTDIHEIKSKVIEHKNQVKMVDIEIRANQGQHKTLKNHLSKLTLQDIDEGPTELPILTAEEIEQVAINSVQYEIGRIQGKMKDMNPDLSAIAEFKRKEEIYKIKLKDLECTVAERDRYRSHYENLRKHRLQEFMRGFSIITLKVKELYQMMTLGGDAELELVDSVDPFSEGIEYSVRPLRKSWKSIRNLSGGEKTLSSLSLVFALHFYRSTPFFVMDEIDAALDFRNVSIIASYIKDCTKNAQFIVISLRENMFMLADHLLGIYKTNNRTKNVYINRLPSKVPEKAVIQNTSTNTSFDRLLNMVGKKQQNSAADTNEADDSFDRLLRVVGSNQQGNSTEGTGQVDGIHETNHTLNKTSVNASIVFGENPNRSVSSQGDIEKEPGHERVDIINSQMSMTLNTSNKSDQGIVNESALGANLNKFRATQNLSKSAKENLGKSTGSKCSALKTPKRKIAEALDESNWSEDEDFVIKTPGGRKGS